MLKYNTWIISALLDDKMQRNRQNMAEIDKCRGGGGG